MTFLPQKFFHGQWSGAAAKSALLHGCLFAMIVLAAKGTFSFFSSSTSPKVKFLESAVKVDVVGMPKKTLKELKKTRPAKKQTSPVAPTAKKAPAAPAPSADSEQSFKKVDKNAKNKTKDKGQADSSNFLNRLKQIGQESVKRAKKAPTPGQGVELQGLIAAGNKLSEGTALVGPPGDRPAGRELAKYAQSLAEAIRPYWKLPSYLKGQDLNCRVQVFIHPRGDLIRAEIYKESAQNEYDQRALEAVKKAAPFSPVPKALQGTLRRGEIVLGFPL